MTAFRIPVALLCAAGLALFTPSPALAQKIKPGGGQAYPYTLVDLLGAFRPTGGYQSNAASLCEPDVTGSLLIVGHTHVPSPQPALWDVAANGEFDTGTINLGLPPGAREASATDVNDEGIVVLNTDQSDNANYPAWVLVPGRALQSLPQIGQGAHASAINNLGEIVGSTGNGGALWRLDDQERPGQPVLLGDFTPQDINDIGQMAGSINGQAAMAAFDNNNILQIVRIGPSYSADFRSQAAALSADGRWLAGHFDHRVDGSMLQEAFAWHVTDGFLPLGTLNGVGQSWASGVNSSGQVVGTSTVTGRMPQAAFLWQNGTMTNLNSLVATGGKYLQLGNRINEHGDIVGLLRIGKPVSEIHAFLLIPRAQ